ncbi:hypothetical protein [Brachyspira hampsonii]|nr:hypothetical protein [Brachyspira hampsonii]
MYEDDEELDDSFFEGYGGGVLVPSDYDEDEDDSSDDFCGDVVGSI